MSSNTYSDYSNFNTNISMIDTVLKNHNSIFCKMNAIYLKTKLISVVVNFVIVLVF
jgi:hypothetical protein